MHPLDDKTLMAYADGQLDPEQRAGVEIILNENREARELVQMFQETRHLLNETYDAPLHQPVPARLLATLADDEHITPLHSPQMSWYRSTMVPWSLAAIVAICAVGLAAGIFTEIGPGARKHHPELTDTLLNQALENQSSGSPLVLRGDGVTREIVPLLTFQDTENRFCREFENRLIHAFGKNTITVGTACRDSEGWQVQVVMNRDLLVQDARSSAEYQPASGESSISPYDMLMDRMMHSLPTTPAEEAELIKGNWRKSDR